MLQASLGCDGGSNGRGNGFRSGFVAVLQQLRIALHETGIKRAGLEIRVVQDLLVVRDRGVYPVIAMSLSALRERATSSGHSRAQTISLAHMES